jgi:hypothetical protein
VALDVAQRAFDRRSRRAQDRCAIRAALAVAKQEVQLLRDLDLEEPRRQVVAVTEGVMLEHVAMQDLVQPRGSRQHRAAAQPALERPAIEPQGRVLALDRDEERWVQGEEPEATSGELGAARGHEHVRAVEGQRAAAAGRPLERERDRRLGDPHGGGLGERQHLERR